MPKAKSLALLDGGYYWVAIDDGTSFKPLSYLPEGPHLARLDCIDGEWRATLLGRQGGTLEIGNDLTKRIVRGSWPREAIWGVSWDQREVRITWIAAVKIAAMPTEIEPI